MYQRGDGQLTVYFLRRRYADKGWICDDAARRECLCNQSFLSEKKEYDSRKWHIHHGHAMFMLSLSLSLSSHDRYSRILFGKTGEIPILLAFKYP